MKLFHPLIFVDLEITSNCNLNCKHCFISNDKTELSFDSIKKILLELNKNFIKKPFICITGGEPLVHKNIKEILELLEKYKFNFSIMTNGTLVDNSMLKLFSKLTGLKKIGLSIDGNKSTHDYIRGETNYTKVINILEQINALNKKIIIKTVLMKSNINSIIEIDEILENYKIARWHIVPYCDYNNSNDELLNKQELNDIKIKLYNLSTKSKIKFIFGEEGNISLKKKQSYCLQGINSISITSNGDIFPCINGPRTNEYLQGNIYNDNIFDIWNFKFNTFRKFKWNGCPYQENFIVKENL